MYDFQSYAPLVLTQRDRRVSGWQRTLLSRPSAFLAYCGLWVSVFIYAVCSGVVASFSAPGALWALDRVLPLQVVAGVVALAVFFAGKQFRAGSPYRLVARVPIVVSMISVLLSLGWAATLVDQQRALPFEAPISTPVPEASDDIDLTTSV
ncbi:MAG: hypothetical protein AAF667_08585 [Pseudomonadota bacterium]